MWGGRNSSPHDIIKTMIILNIPTTNTDYSYIASLFRKDNVVFYETKSMSARAVEQMVKSKKRKDFIISNNRQKVGWCNIRWNAADDEATFGVIIDKQFWRKGYGTQTIKHIENEIRILGINKIKIKVLESNVGALKLYNKLDYIEGEEKIVILEKKLL